MQTLSLQPAWTCAPECLEDIVAIVRHAERNQQQVHAFGSKWSFSDCAIGLDPAASRLIATTQLYQPLQTVQRAMVNGDPAHVYHVQAGITIQQLYTNLDAMGLALETMGGSSAQTLAGAISTGTHGGDLFMAPLADSVLAIHLVGAGGTQYWIEPSPGITDPALLRQFVAPDVAPQNIIYDDSFFDAVLVSLGCMGVIYAVVLRVRDQYNLIETTTQTTWRDFVPTAAGLLGGTSNPNNRFLQVLVDPYPDSSGNNVCLVTTRTEGGSGDCNCSQGDLLGAALGMLADLLAANPAEAPALGIEGIGALISGDPRVSTIYRALATLIDAILVQAPDLRTVLVQDYGSIMLASWPPGTCGGKSYCVMDSTRRVRGSNSPPKEGPPTPGLSIEMFFQSVDLNGNMPWVSFVNKILGMINAATSTFLGGYIALRFSGLTRACLGMQRFRQNCSVEISTLRGIQGEQALLTSILDLMYTFGGLPHWGQLLDLPGGIQGNGKLYPRFQEWRQIYGQLSNNFSQRTFENALSVRWQLTTP
jgi:hypothetical protein